MVLKVLFCQYCVIRDCSFLYLHRDHILVLFLKFGAVCVGPGKQNIFTSQVDKNYELCVWARFIYELSVFVNKCLVAFVA